MPKSPSSSMIPSSGGFLRELAFQIKLILRLIADQRVNPLLKILPIGSLLYWLIPDLAVGPIDDAAVIFIGMYLFIELCPPSIVEEHRRQLIEGSPTPNISSEEVIDAEFHEAADEPSPTESQSEQHIHDR